MALSFELSKALPEDVPVVAVPVCSDRLGGQAGEGDGSTGGASGLDWGHLEANGCRGTLGQTFVLPATDGGPATLVVGMGPSGEVGPDQLRRAGAAVARAAKRYPSVAVRLLDAVAEPARRPAAAQGLAEGLVLGSYRFTTYKSEPDPQPLERVVVIGGGGTRLRRGARARVAHRRRRRAGPGSGEHSRRRAHPVGPGPGRGRDRRAGGSADQRARPPRTSWPRAWVACSA